MFLLVVGFSSPVHASAHCPGSLSILARDDDSAENGDGPGEQGDGGQPQADEADSVAGTPMLLELKEKQKFSSHFTEGYGEYLMSRPCQSSSLNMSLERPSGTPDVLPMCRPAFSSLLIDLGQPRLFPTSSLSCSVQPAMAEVSLSEDHLQRRFFSYRQLFPPRQFLPPEN